MPFSGSYRAVRFRDTLNRHGSAARPTRHRLDAAPGAAGRAGAFRPVLAGARLGVGARAVRIARGAGAGGAFRALARADRHRLPLAPRRALDRRSAGAGPERAHGYRDPAAHGRHRGDPPRPGPEHLARRPPLPARRGSVRPRAAPPPVGLFHPLSPEAPPRTPPPRTPT